jgi:flavin reductase (DIM6/NTAB) family NADH-FMN oxidoreductase RutF
MEMSTDERSTLAGIAQILELLDREIWIVTAAANGRASGLVATWVSAASIDPERPLMLAGLSPNHFTTELVQASGGFGLHLVKPEQADLVWRFGLSSGRDTDKFLGLAHRAGKTGSPILDDCLAWLDCQVVHRYDAGDRLFFWARIIDGQRKTNGTPLREKQAIAAASPLQLATMQSRREADIKLLRSAAEKWLADCHATAANPEVRERY